MKLAYPVCLYPAESGYIAVIPDLNHRITGTKELGDTIYMATDTASLLILKGLEEGRKPPEPSDPLKIKADEYENGMVSVIMLDIDAYVKKYGKQVVRKCCTIPAWLNTAAEARGVNFSAVLQSALIDQLGLDQ